MLCVLTVYTVNDVLCCSALYLCVLEECTASIFVVETTRAKETNGVYVGNGRGMLFVYTVNRCQSRLTNNADQ